VRAQEIIGTGDWWASSQGEALRRLESAWAGAALADAFGFFALQVGMPDWPGLRGVRIPHRWVGRLPMDGTSSEPLSVEDGSSVLQCQPERLPFPSQSLDLLVMPHTLERSEDPHQVIRESHRVLLPEGRLWLSGFSPDSYVGWSMWRAGRRSGGMASPLPSPSPSFARMRDWLHLLGFEVESAQVAVFGPWALDEPSQPRWPWAEALGRRWCPSLASVYSVCAVKRVVSLRGQGVQTALRQVRRTSPSWATAPAGAREATRRASGGSAT
jgi:SAM-dependent methyltransferase